MQNIYTRKTHCPTCLSVLHVYEWLKKWPYLLVKILSARAFICCNVCLTLSSDAFSISDVIPLSTNLISFPSRKRHDKKSALCLVQCCYSVCILLLNAAALYSSAVRRAKWNLTWFAFMLGANTQTEHITHIYSSENEAQPAFHVICADALHFQSQCTSLRSFFTRQLKKKLSHPVYSRETHYLSSGKWECALCAEAYFDSDSEAVNLIWMYHLLTHTAAAPANCKTLRHRNPYRAKALAGNSERKLPATVRALILISCQS
jgi:hypothetical protein